jgi:formamidopyrimidine-DNA glycosylase
MPELPEVETTVSQLNKEVLGRKILDCIIETKKLIKKPKSIQAFRKQIKGAKIEKIWRRGKNIIFELSNKKFLLVHLKLTGHFLIGKWKKEKNNWTVVEGNEALKDPMNRFLRIIFLLDDGRELALCDLRKFAKIEILEKKDLEKQLSKLGPEPLDESFTLEKFKEILSKVKKGKIKKVLMDQQKIAGIGNIYSDEILWEAKVHPAKNVKKLKEEEIKKIFEAMKKILKKGIESGGESISDFRQITGEKGKFDEQRKVYKREGEKCFRCGAKIKRMKFGERSSYFCPLCQKK